MDSKPSLRAWSMWAVALVFFAYQFIMRLFPGLVMHDIMAKHHIDVLAFGVLSSMYYFGYAAMQIPVALLLDRFGPRKVISLCALICSLATLLFVYATSWQVVLLARCLIGVGSAAGFLGTSKVISSIFPEQQYAKMIGLSFTVGLAGALYGGKPVSLLIATSGWEKVGALVGICGLCFAALSWCVLQPMVQTHNTPRAPIFKSLGQLFRNRYLIALAVANLLMVGSLEGFADVWGVSFLTSAFALEKADAAFVVSCIFLGMLCGGPLLAALASRWSAYYLVTAGCGLLTAVLFGILLTGFPNIPYLALCSVLFLVGIFCCYQVLIFAIGSKLVPPELKGVTVAFLNCINMLGGSFFHLVIGSLLKFSGGEAAESLHTYTPHQFASALSAIPICAVIGALVVLFVGMRQRRRVREDPCA